MITNITAGSIVKVCSYDTILFDEIDRFQTQSKTVKQNTLMIVVAKRGNFLFVACEGCLFGWTIQSLVDPI